MAGNVDAINQTDTSNERPAGHRSKLIISLSIIGIMLLGAVAWAVNKKNEDIKSKEAAETAEQVEGGDAGSSAPIKNTLMELVRLRGKNPETQDELMVPVSEPIKPDPIDVYQSYTKTPVDKDTQAEQFELQIKQEQRQWQLSALRDDIGTNTIDSFASVNSQNAERITPSVQGGVVSSDTTSRVNVLQKRLKQVKAQAQGRSVTNQQSIPSEFSAGNFNLNDSPVPEKETLSGTGFDDAGQDPLGMLVPPSTVIDAVLNQRINTDNPAHCVGIVRHNVYNLERTHILIPQGSKVVCVVKQYKGANKAINTRVAMGAKQIVRPDGEIIQLDNLEILELDGTGGVSGETDLHLFAQVMGTFAYALIGEAPALASDASTESVSGQATADVLNELSGQFRPMANKYLNLVPTTELERGTPFKIVLARSLKIKPYKALSSFTFGGL